MEKVAYIVRRLGITAGKIRNPEALPSRVQLQKVAYFLAVRGFLGYRFTQYWYGPHSSRLADYYMRLAELGNEEIEKLASRCSDCWRMEKYLDVLKGYDVRTLEAAATLHDIYKSWPLVSTWEDAERVFIRLKPWHKDRLEDAKKLLRELGLM